MTSGNKPYMVRGGSWYGSQRLAHCAIYSEHDLDYFGNDIGFRVVTLARLAKMVSQPSFSVLDTEPRVVHGGSWDYSWWSARCAARDRFIPSVFLAATDIGFRVAIISLSEDETP